MSKIYQSALGAMLSLWLAAPAHAQVNVVSAGSPYAVHVMSYRDIPFRTVVRQQFDYSCGSAALATLLKYHYDRSVGEAEIFKAMYASGDQAKIRRLGFSLLDMKTYLADIGMSADGYRLTYPELQQLTSPSIAVVVVGRYKHFVVIKGVIGDRVLVGDPALGLKKYSQVEFAKIWSGVVFMIHDDRASRGAFNQKAEWKPWAQAPAAEPLDANNLGSMSIQRPPLYQVTQFLPLSPTGH